MQKRQRALLLTTALLGPLPFAPIPAAAQTGCMAECPSFANCVGHCMIEAPEGTSCSAVCTTTGCNTARCWVFGGPECNQVEEETCERRPAKRSSRPQSPLDSSWAIFEIDEASPFSPKARGVLAASTPEFGQEALIGFWQREYRRRQETNSAASFPIVRVVFFVDSVGGEPAEPSFRLVNPAANPGFPPESSFYFRAATEGYGDVVAVEPIYSTTTDTELFTRFIEEQYRVESLSISGVPIYFYGSIRVDREGRPFRGMVGTTLLSGADLERFRQILK